MFVNAIATKNRTAKFKPLSLVLQVLASMPLLQVLPSLMLPIAIELIRLCLFTRS
jgi:hypothetical protein